MKLVRFLVWLFALLCAFFAAGVLLVGAGLAWVRDLFISRPQPPEVPGRPRRDA